LKVKVKITNYQPDYNFRENLTLLSVSWTRFTFYHHLKL